MSAQQIINIIDDYKEKLPDKLYKKICDDLVKINKNEQKYVKVKGIIVTPQSDYDGELTTDEEGVILCVKVIDDDAEWSGNDWKLGKVSNKYIVDSIEKVEKFGYDNVAFDNGKNSTLIILKISYFN
tara:strand:- start:3 stop:383 length:381 start_codon:yes stop_codon:yes gene_type:complete